MAIDFTNQSPAVLLINNYPIVFDGVGVTLKTITESMVAKAEDKKAFDWKTMLSGFYSGSNIGSNNSLNNTATNQNILSNTDINTLYMRPVFSGLTLDIIVTEEWYGSVFVILKPLIEFLYRQGENAKQYTSFFSVNEYILDGYIESSSMSRESKDNKRDWHLVIKSRQALVDSLQGQKKSNKVPSKLIGKNISPSKSKLEALAKKGLL